MGRLSRFGRWWEGAESQKITFGGDIADLATDLAQRFSLAGTPSKGSAD